MTTVELTDDDFAATIKDNDIVLIDFWAAWCAPCHRFAPIFEQSSQDNPDIVHGKLDVEAAQRIADAAGITAVPTLMAFREGIQVFNETGTLPAAALAQVVEVIRNLDMNEVRNDTASESRRQTR